MPLALPGFVDTGRTISCAYTATLQLNVIGAGIMPKASWPPINSFFGTNGFVSISVGDWNIRGTQLFDDGTFGGPSAGSGRTYVWLDQVTGYDSSGVPLYTYVALETTDWTASIAAGPTHQQASGSYSFVDTMGPFRLGMKFARIPPAASQSPEFLPRDYRVTYEWWGDNSTTRACSFAGHSFSQVWNLGGIGATGAWRTGLNVNSTPVSAGYNLGAITLVFGGDSNVSTGTFPDVTYGIFTSLSYNGTAADTSGLDQTNLKGDGGGAAHLLNHTNNPDGATIYPPYLLEMDLSITKFGGDDIGATLNIATNIVASGLVTTPFRGSYSVRGVSWESSWSGLFEASVNAAWAAAQNPALPATDLWVPLFFAPPRGVDDYRPITISLAPQVEVHRPAGVIPSNWVASDSRITVTETMPETVIEVHEEGAYIERAFAGTQTWRNHVGLGTGGTGHADFGIEDYEVYRHNYTGWGATGEDVWAWGTYAWLGYEINAVGAASLPDHELTLVAAGNHLAITDTHETSLASRIANYVAALTAYDASYSVLVVNGTKAGRVDLLFPTETQPFYHGRVDALRLSGFKVGTYRIKKLRLEATGQAYLKCAWGLQVQRSDYSALVAAVNGAFVFGNWPDQALKDDETGDYGGGIRYVDIVTGTGTGTITDSQKTLTAFILLLNKIEGWTASFDTGVRDAAMKDPYGADLGTDPAQFLRPIVPYYRLAPGEAYRPPCAVLCRDVQTAAGIPFEVVCLWPLWGALEAQAKTDGLRAESGAEVQAYRLDTGATVATGVTDEDGYICCSPVPANGAVSVSLREAV